ncbi:MAG: hypothetical protein V4850_30815 [Myxococcota bacterium]
MRAPRWVVLLSFLSLPLRAHAGDTGAPVTCEVVPPGSNQYKLAVGYASARGSAPRAREDALAAARDDARKALHADLCAAMPADCGRYAGYVTAWQTPGVYDEKARRACATAVVEMRLLNPDRQRAEAEARVAALGDELAGKLAAAKVTAVRLAAPARADGCVVPELEPLRMWVGSRLGRHGVSPLADDTPGEAPEIELVAVVTEREVTIAASATLTDGTQLLAEPVTFPASAYNVPATGARCVPHADLGLDYRGRRAGAVRLDLRVPTRGGALCVGQPVEPVLTVDQPAGVHVYSVDATGAAYHIWPLEGSDVVNYRLDLGRSYAVPNMDGEDETLVAVALPEADARGPIGGHIGFCRVSGGLHKASFPPGATVVSSTWHVATGTECGTPPPDMPARELLERMLQTAPNCR